MTDWSAVGVRLEQWYREQARDLPWRRRTDPYAIWVSEVMLQQTTVATVVPRFEAFLARFTSVSELAAASEDDVLAELQGLGYYRRFRAMKRAAEQMVAESDGEIPRDPKDLKRLPGVGDYMVGAIASIAFDDPIPAVDGNVIRVISRLARLESAGESVKERRAFEAIVIELLRDTRPSRLTQALFDLGATVCLPKIPKCRSCPVAKSCEAHRVGDVERFPPPKKKRATVDVVAAHAFIESGGELLFVRRAASENRMPGFLELPGVWLTPGQDPTVGLAEYLQEKCGFMVEIDPEPMAEARHAITHHRIKGILYRGRIVRTGKGDEEVIFRNADQRDSRTAPVTTLTSKMLRRVAAADGDS